MAAMGRPLHEPEHGPSADTFKRLPSLFGAMAATNNDPGSLSKQELRCYSRAAPILRSKLRRDYPLRMRSSGRTGRTILKHFRAARRYKCLHQVDALEPKVCVKGPSKEGQARLGHV